MSVRSITKVKGIYGKRILVRVDFNVPVKSGKVLDDARLKASLPTIQYLIKKGARVILVTHLGRPEGKRDKKLSTAPVAKRLAELSNYPVAFLPNWTGMALHKHIENMKPGEVAMLENIRFAPGEEKNDPELAQELSGLADIFVLDGFAVAHRAAASVVGVSQYLPSYAGLLLEAEIRGLERVTKQPKKPFVAVIGGAKMETKVPVIQNLLPKASFILVGGGIVNTYLAAKGYGVGESLVDRSFSNQTIAYGENKKVIWPVDVVVGRHDGSRYRAVNIESRPHQLCEAGEGIYDLGPATIRMYAGYIKKAKTLVWNGAMGYFEQKPYDVGTLSIARLVAARSRGKAFGVIGGGETLQAMARTDMGEYVDLVSTGGGAMLEFLAGKKLSGVEALTNTTISSIGINL